MITEIQKERLLKLANHIEKDMIRSYHHGSFISKNFCGTTCCALGEAAYSKIFPDLRLEIAYELGRPYLLPLNDTHDVTEIADEFFGENAYCHIFSEDAYSYANGDVTRTDVIERMRYFVAQGGL